MILPIYVYGSPVLKKETEEIDETYPELQTFIADMFETMAHSDGIGLAAPQVGKSIRIFVLDASTFANDKPELKNYRKAFINPVILERAGEMIYYNEGCLSFPKLHEDVYRESRVRVEYFNENFEKHDEWFDGIVARIIQHEYDHLEGKLFVERLSIIRRKLITAKLKRIAKGDFSASYKTKLQTKN
ncbi:MAG: peptide deformylase [Prevotellaceae bacterium]|jgi:peptide deformylase|nr:peptide deformylase [Prevotellaceae bacterium]